MNLSEYVDFRPRLDFLLGNRNPLQRTSTSCIMDSRLVQAWVEIVFILQFYPTLKTRINLTFLLNFT